ncbi:hypothetical protein [Streptomyces sp. TRM64462]|uniref:hypothetical protein n=1 Tax=Streptomyces sp. TRM64462 TaxID=2741726 RepID=UPI001586BDF9|nr:hypothetical protein [Streptomyces sp. TRM64462]
MYTGNLSRTALRRTTMAVATVAAAAVFTTTAAHAAPARSGDEKPTTAAAQAAAVVEKATGTADILPAATTPEGSMRAVAATEDGVSTVTAPATTQGVVEATAADGSTVGIGLPDVAKSSATATDNGTIVYSGADSATDVAVQPTVNGVRSLVVINNASAAKEYRFDLHLPDGAVAEKQQDGSVTVSKGDEVLGTFDAPWAKDARGEAVPTSYRVEDGALVQTVAFDKNTAFPVVADPSWWDQTKFVAKCGAAVAGVLLTFLPAGSSIKVVRAVALFKKYGAKKTATIIWRFVNGKRVGSKEREAVKAFIGITAISNACQK